MAKTRDTSVAAGRYKAPAMIEHTRHGQPLAKPYPRARRRLRTLLLLAWLLAVTGAAILGLPTGLIAVVAALAAWLLPSRLVPTPYPAFLTLERLQAFTLQAPAWIRLPDGNAVEALNVTYRVPAISGDATPPQIHVRCSDGVTRHYRPHETIHVVQPVDVR